jgi:peptidoglycan hydrolase-like protein with peptidoglycan-binding domain
MHLCRVTTVAALVAAGCSAGDQVEPQVEGEATDVDSLAVGLQKLNSDLRIGASGDDVRTVHRYFQRYGYFPSSNLTSEYPGWAPVVAQDPAFDDVFDERTQEAVLKLQYQFGIEQTGVVDAATRDALRSKRESVIDRIDALAASTMVEKFSYPSGAGTVSPQLGITWRMNSPTDDNISLDNARAAIQAALNTWRAETNLSFTEVRNNNPVTIDFRFQALGVDGPYRATTPVAGSDVTFDSNDSFSIGGAGGTFDLQTVALQAIGRALGLGLSSISGAVMHTTLSPGLPNRSLTTDDKVAISALYDAWVGRFGAARDISAGIASANDVWAIGDAAAPEGGFTIHQWNGSDWNLITGMGGKRISGGAGNLWVVANDNTLRQRNSNGTWSNRGGCAKDIAAGTTSSNVWAIGCDDRVYKWIPASLSWAQANNGTAVKIAVTRAGIPWVVNGAGEIFERTTTSHTAGTWIERPSDSCALDIGALDHVWVTSCVSAPGGGRPAVWNVQPAVGNAPARAEWKFVDGGAVQITDSLGGPWAVNDAKVPFQRTKN